MRTRKRRKRPSQRSDALTSSKELGEALCASPFRSANLTRPTDFACLVPPTFSTSAPAFKSRLASITGLGLDQGLKETCLPLNTIMAMIVYALGVTSPHMPQSVRGPGNVHLLNTLHAEMFFPWL